MKKIKINGEIKDFSGNVAAIVDGKPMTVRDVIMQQVGSYSSATGKETLENYALGMKIHECKFGLLELEEAEFKQLEKVLNSKPIKISDVAMAPVLMALEEAKAEKPEKEVPEAEKKK